MLAELPSAASALEAERQLDVDHAVVVVIRVADTTVVDEGVFAADLQILGKLVV